MITDPHPDAQTAIRGAGLRVTESRRAVYEALCEHPHASADDVFARVVATVPSTSLQSVYNALNDFVDAGLVRRIEPAGRAGLFELRVSDNHHHIVCRSCGAVEDVDCVHGAAPCLQPSGEHGYALEVAEVTFWGLCPACSTDVAA
ncbi:Fur family transcriptional regulator [Microbacterium immunditiarum]|uniref:Fur family ferric uptake transcriptional regulator n=1 Tax=Microbacterium immunditiarum TaxID=337480 RepID=A0A7Y9KKM7_9MICO|nr:Fur family transcriptional regulator [Microbacterium immunditiarum]NYE20995.1 Fur family ferric uptake transcriptional regulator [Microbacterium immunditiarum]